MREIGFGEKKYPIFWDIYAHDEILKASHEAGFGTLGEWMSSDPVGAYSIILCELMKGGARRHNYEVAQGYKNGDIIPMDDIAPEQCKTALCMLHARDFMKIEKTINLCWADASKAEVPDELKKYMPDDDYMEIAAEIEKNKPESEKN